MSAERLRIGHLPLRLDFLVRESSFSNLWLSALPNLFSLSLVTNFIFSPIAHLAMNSNGFHRVTKRIRTRTQAASASEPILQRIIAPIWTKSPGGPFVVTRIPLSLSYSHPF